MLLTLAFVAAAYAIDDLEEKKRERERLEEEERKRRKAEWKRKLVEFKRRYSRVTYDVISKDEFEKIVREEAAHFGRITNVQVGGVLIFGEVWSQSGKSTWEFQLDFNDFGKITGSWWLKRDKADCDIPVYFANRIQARLAAKYR